MYSYTAYTGTFKDISNTQYQLDILQNTSISPTTIRLAAAPVTIEYSDFAGTVNGSGAIINLLSQTNMQFLNLFTADIKEYQVVLKKSGSIIWQGYIDTENYNEPLADLNNYEVQVTANDGLAILNRMKYLNGSSNYTGATSLWNIITECFTKIGLNYQYIYVSSGLTLNGVTITNTVFHIASTFNDNYYDENNEPFTCRKVLENILLNYKLFIYNNCVYIVYPELLENTSIVFKRFDASNYAYVDIVSVSTAIGDLSTIKFTSTDSQMSIMTAYNKQVIEYSPYPQTSIMNYDVKNDNLSNLYTTFDKGLYWDAYKNSDHWTLVTSGTSFFIHQYDPNGGNPDNDEFYILMSGGTNYSPAVTYKAKLPYIVNNDDSDSTWFETPSDGIKRYALKITVNAEFRSGWMASDDPKDNIRLGKLRALIKIGDYQYKYSGTGYLGAWTGETTPTSDSNCLVLIYANDNKGTSIDMQPINNKTLNNLDGSYYDGRFIQMDLFTVYPQRTKWGGQLEFSILNKFTAEDQNGVDKTSLVKYVKIKSVTISLYDAYGNAIDENNVKYTATLNGQYEKEATTVKTILGTNLNNVPTERGALLSYNTGGGYYEYVTGLTQQHTSTTDKFENIVLTNYVDQNSIARVKIDASVNQLSNIVGHLTYNNYFAGTKFLITNLKRDLEYKSDTITIIEKV